MIKIIPYQPAWSEEFRMLGAALRKALGDLALRIDHIGSTSVPGLAAKDIIDIQITVQDLGPAVAAAIRQVGYERIENITQDHLPPGSMSPMSEWTKWIFKPPPFQRPTNLHARIAGRANQRYALLFRDYLRVHPPAAQAYAQVKSALAKYHPLDFDAYYDVKDPVCDIIMSGAEIWAEQTQWQPGPSDC